MFKFIIKFCGALLLFPALQAMDKPGSISQIKVSQSALDPAGLFKKIPLDIQKYLLPLLVTQKSDPTRALRILACTSNYFKDLVYNNFDHIRPQLTALCTLRPQPPRPVYPHHFTISDKMAAQKKHRDLLIASAKNNHPVAYVLGCPDQELILWASGPSLAALKQTIAADLNYKKYLEQVLVSASEAGLFPLVRLLVQAGIPVDTHGFTGTALIRAACNGYYSIAKFLLEHGANVNFVTQSELTPLMFAIIDSPKNKQKDHYKLVELLLTYNPNMSYQNSSNQNALNLANWPGKEAIVKLLLDKGADPKLLEVREHVIEVG